MNNGIGRLALAIVLGIGVAILLGLQAASAYAERRAPELAIQLNPLNGMAAEQAAYRRFSSTTSDPETVTPEAIASAAANARPLALSSYASEPLAPKSLTVLALAADAADVRGDILTIATRLNRRDLALQLAKFEYQVGQRDEIATLNTLDQLLRVHPEFSDRFFPPLQQALLNPDTHGTFSAMLNGSSPWHEAFAMAAVRSEAARVPLAQIRPNITIEDEQFDRLLIAGLAAQGELELAKSMYELRAKPDDRTEGKGTNLSWRGDFPPFDWGFTDQKEIRAQPSLSGDKLEVFVRPGQGGVIASRIVVPQSPEGTIAFRLDSTRAIIPGRMRAALYCGSSKEPIASSDLTKGQNELDFEADAETCSALRIELYARAYRSDPVLRASIGRITVS